MKNQVVAVVSEEKRDEVEKIWERMNSLNGIVLLLSDNKELLDKEHIYDKVVSDLSEENKKYSKWWERFGIDYGIDVNYLSKFQLNFKTCEILSL